MEPREVLVAHCARAAHEVNRVWCEAYGDTSQAHWEDAPEWQRQSSIQGVEFALRGGTPDQQHDAWCEDKVADGWMYGPTKDAAAKTHPCLVGYDSLPETQRKKDGIYIAVVRSMAAAFGLSAA